LHRGVLGFCLEIKLGRFVSLVLKVVLDFLKLLVVVLAHLDILVERSFRGCLAGIKRDIILVRRRVVEVLGRVGHALFLSSTYYLVYRARYLFGLSIDGIVDVQLFSVAFSLLLVDRVLVVVFQVGVGVCQIVLIKLLAETSISGFNISRYGCFLGVDRRLLHDFGVCLLVFNFKIFLDLILDELRLLAEKHVLDRELVG